MLLVLALLAGSALAGCSSDNRTTITFFQFKAEAQQYFQQLAAQFERANPDIRVVVDNPADPETALRTRLVKNDVPDVMTLNGNGTFGEFASAKIFRDFRDDPVLADVNPAYLSVTGSLGAGSKGEVNGVPFAANASGLLYNKELFAEQGVAVPTTFDELIAAAKKFQAAGITPFYGTLADAWTAQSPLAPLSAQLQPADFFQQRFEGRTTFAEGWRSTAAELAELYRYTQPDPLSKGYEDGTAAFARGESAMLLLGSYAVPQIRDGKPGFTVASMALPATNDPAKTSLVSGVDVVLTASRNGAHPAESSKFINFLMGTKVMQDYCAAQVAIPTLKGLTNDDPALTGVQSYIRSGRIVGFTDHQFIQAIPLGPLLQEFLITGDENTFLRKLDSDWDKVAKRRTWGLGAVIKS
ncbi:ABC transporter substrate-binding protein [Actinoplanes friuliensis]|jgi:raffinose/stachyose/melibiose transport system substrate-binding protein|uniref:Family 1 extracellular solute-binding protein n=1 Tax=Actinoplanes friuliensis DSM 7358 TaxID=1246995 RepID=U5VWJ3_9ACTN|nr:extracellular solute-binding protein [Actinoplanes friuliensis]AGZ41152.1 family 1 extracellular solute-binding protein [Actinoplanes friuliensis DSM 7358]